LDVEGYIYVDARSRECALEAMKRAYRHRFDRDPHLGNGDICNVYSEEERPEIKQQLLEGSRSLPKWQWDQCVVKH